MRNLCKIGSSIPTTKFQGETEEKVHTITVPRITYFYYVAALDSWASFVLNFFPIISDLSGDQYFEKQGG